jgi:hypothetical protein
MSFDCIHCWQIINYFLYSKDDSIDQAPRHSLLPRRINNWSADKIVVAKTISHIWTTGRSSNN